MKKSKITFNNNGFMLLETLIVSTVILGTLVFLYVQFVNVKSSYEVSFTYNTIPGIYMSKELGEFIAGTVQNNGRSTLVKLQTDLSSNDNTNGYISINPDTVFAYPDDTSLYKEMIQQMNIKSVLVVDDSDDLSKIKSFLSTGSNVEQDIFEPQFKKYILSLATDNTGKCRLIVAFNDQTFASVLIGDDE